MSLQGTLDAFDLADVLYLLERGEKSGALDVRSDEVGGVLYLHEGVLVGAESDNAPVVAGDGPQFERALVEVCATLLRCDSGAFRFDEARRPMVMTSARVPVAPVVEGARQLAAEWRALEAAIPSLDTPVLVAPELPVDSLRVDRAMWRLLVVLDGRRSVREVARDLGRPVPEVGREIVALLELGLVAFYEAAPDPAVLPELGGTTVWDRFDAPAGLGNGLGNGLGEDSDEDFDEDFDGQFDDDGDGEAPGDALRRDRGALLRMFSSLKE